MQTTTSRTILNSRAAIALLTKTDVARVYSGKAHKCCCGCSGKYSEAPAQITRVLNIIKDNAINVQTGPSFADRDATYISVELDGRLYTAYLN